MNEFLHYCKPIDWADYTADYAPYQYGAALAKTKTLASEHRYLLLSTGGEYKGLRKAFYRLAAHSQAKIYDAGQLLGQQPKLWTEYFVAALEAGVIPLVFGSQAEEFSQALLDEELEPKLQNWLCLSPALSRSKAFQVLLQAQKEQQLRLRLLAMQGHYEDPMLRSVMRKKRLHTWSLGELRSDGLHYAEPLFRETEVALVELAALRRSDAQGLPEAGVNGLFGEEFCKLMRYAGLSDKLAVLYLDTGSLGQEEEQGAAELAAQALWYCLAGLEQRAGEAHPDLEQLLCFRVEISSKKSLGQELGLCEFFKSEKTGRWWFRALAEEELIACCYEDYKQAAERGELSDALFLALLRGY